VTVSGELAADILDEHGGWRGKVGVDREFSIYDVTLAPGLSVEGIDAKAANHYYGVRPAEATATRPAYRLDDVWNIGLDVGARYSLTEKVALFGALQYTLLDAAIRRSPIVAHDALFSVFLSVAYAL